MDITFLVTLGRRFTQLRRLIRALDTTAPDHLSALITELRALIQDVANALSEAERAATDLVNP